jgi:hypothetical protein
MSWSRLRASSSSRDASQITATQASSMSTVAAALAKLSAATYVLSPRRWTRPSSPYWWCAQVPQGPARFGSYRKPRLSYSRIYRPGSMRTSDSATVTTYPSSTPFFFWTTS